CLQLPSDSTSRWTPLLLANGWLLPTPIADFHRLVNRHARRTKKALKTLLNKRFGSFLSSTSVKLKNLSSSYQSIVSLGQELYGNTNEGFQILDALSNYDDNLYKAFMQLLILRKGNRHNVEGLEIIIK
ncbi:hypothetical protein, partial [Caldibacillus thermoamylovorans]|uniref:hypothetical protein n=1 Tax=Caldibacillus thermoamylovorans TaxID=35841 RepID=UPI0037C19CFD|nr:hypothetical protein [Caldibacillus thermoamylovorans]